MIDNRFFKGNKTINISNESIEMLHEIGLNKDLSFSQVARHENKAQTLLSAYRDNRVIEGNDTILNNNDTLVNYTITLEGDRVSVKDKFTNYQYGFFSLSNKKLKRDSRVTYVIWNITQKITCKYKTNVCSKVCYADKYPNSTDRNILGRNKNLILSTYRNFKTIFLEVLELVNRVFKNTVLIRIHESGDIYNLEYANKLLSIVESNPYKNKSLVYTKNIELIDFIKDLKQHPLFKIRYSIMKDTKKEYQDLVLNNDLNTFICKDKKDTEHNNMIQLCGGLCSNCLLCWNSNIKNIFVDTH